MKQPADFLRRGQGTGSTLVQRRRQIKPVLLSTIFGVLVFLAILAGGFSSVAAENIEAGHDSRGSIGRPNPAQLLKVSKILDGPCIRFFVENSGSADVTATFDLSLVNLRGSTNFPFTTTFNSHERREAFSLSAIDQSRQWHYTLTNYFTLGNDRAVHDDTFVYSLPYAAGQAFRVTQAYNGNFSHFGQERYAIDWKMPEGTPVLAARDGVVVGIKQDSNVGGPDPSFQEQANYVFVQHADGTIGNYAHLQSNGVRVKIGQWITTGTMIALSGNTGFSSGPHLHFSVFKTRDGHERESIPVHFRTEGDSCATLVCGQSYTRPQTVLRAAARNNTDKLSVN